MLDIMSQAKDAIEAYDTRLKAITSNITKVAVPGYKRTEVSFEDIYNKLIHSGTASSSAGNEGGSNPYQLGGSVGIA